MDKNSLPRQARRNEQKHLHIKWNNLILNIVLNIVFCNSGNFFLICIVGGGVQTGSTRHVGHSLAYCTCTGRLWGWRIWWNEWQGKPKNSEKTCPDATLSTTNPTWPDPELNPGRRDGKPATNRFSYGVAIIPVIIHQLITFIKILPMHEIK
jgi:hypothetical protein